ncbi:MAG: phosphoglycerate kinase [Dehalococcoidia bacterium]|jgi:phosphoglycerate kinase
MEKKTIRDIDVAEKRVLVRVDLNVPLDENTGAILDDTRIKAVIPTIRYLIENKAMIILCSHLGRPNGKVIESMRMAPVAKRLASIIEKPVATTSDCIGNEAEKAATNLKNGDLLLLENLRFHVEEEKNDPEFSKALAKLADIYVNDAFGTAHRAHASTVGVTKYIPSVSGFLMQKEIEVMGKALTNPTRPFASIIGGAKISDKIGVLDNILEKVNTLLIGGGMVATFLKAMNYGSGKSSVEEDKLDLARQLMDKAKTKGVKLLLPIDIVVADRFAADAKSKTVPIDKVPDDWFIMDIGHKTIDLFESELKKCKTIIWNGPMGVFEYPKFSRGTASIAKTLAGLKATTIIGGGSTAEAVEEMGLADKMTHVSTGGGASLEFLEGKTLPGVAALQDKK